MLNSADCSSHRAVPPPPRRLSNITLPPHGTVEGSKENAEKEEIFLCGRLVDQSLSNRKDFRQTYWISWNTQVASVIQGMKRPVCGLVAICMAGRMLKRHQPSVPIYQNDEAVLQVAQNLGYTKQGEMFSAKQYADLTREVLGCDAKVMSGTLIGSMSKVLRHLALGYPVLVPYDTDRNFEPCMKKGHRAHWAILTGFVIGIQEPLSKKIHDNSAITKVKNLEDLTEVLDKLDGGSINQSLVYVYAKQGKSARQQLWSLKDLSASNANLNEVCPERDPNMYQFPKEGIQITLCSKSVFVSPKQV